MILIDSASLVQRLWNVCNALRDGISEVERWLSLVKELEAAVEVNLKRAERLRQSILKRAFEGRLVPQDPNDEPADLLLERMEGLS